MTIVVEAFD